MNEITKKTTEQAEKIQQLMAEGKTLEEALQLTSQKAKKNPIDRISYIQALENISELRKARKTAYAKKSKSKDKPETLERYQKEIDVSTERLNQLLAEVNSSETPWKKALELGETPEGAIQYFLTSLEAESEAYFATVDIPKSQIKSLLNKTVIQTEFVPEELREPFAKRLESRDQRVRASAVRHQLMENLKSGATVPETIQKQEPAAKDEGKGKSGKSGKSKKENDQVEEG